MTVLLCETLVDLPCSFDAMGARSHHQRQIRAEDFGFSSNLEPGTYELGGAASLYPQLLGPL
ncbi:hypothetical protein SAMN06265370_104216 [Puniceibacterium sediminis]|uniref:Uncharacterized protein n=1 Tax=Puniceibacterium sediminis TaxID=1608407 RepID=A0A238W816_9RHOB|nr:hypothetical protein SAMN06265370_104216 [Puniceibacterium sediminis]